MLPQFELTGKTVVVIDILRATSCMVTAMAHGIASIKPVASLEECADLKSQGYICAAERDGRQAEGFDLGNSPFSYMNKDLVGKNLGMTTTNGTYAITHSAAADCVVAGAFLNLSAIVEFLHEQPNDVLMVCAGWRGMINAEDTLFAGAVAHMLGDDFSYTTDAPMIAKILYQQATENLMGFLSQSSHVRRLNNLDIYKDVEFCLSVDKYNVIPKLHGNTLLPYFNDVAIES